jgi:thiosulfate dehydrogenase
MENNKQPFNIKENDLVKIIHALIKVVILFTFTIVTVFIFLVFKPNINSWFTETIEEEKSEKYINSNIETMVEVPQDDFWKPAQIAADLSPEMKAQIEYGKELIVHTSKYLGPNGSVKPISNGMNCQNCHLDAGTKPWGNNYGAVFSTYPKYRARSGTKEELTKRVNDCFERSLNGKPLKDDSKEMLAIKAYIEFIGKDVPKGEKPKASGIYELAFLDRPIDPIKGKGLYDSKCQSCHQANGEGQMNADKTEYLYPPLWGKNSYNHGAGLYRMSRMAGYIRYNMPQGASFANSQLTDEEAWDIAAYINTQERPKKSLKNDWPKIEEKPFDHPFGPFADKFTEAEHKFGPYQPIVDAKKQNKK